MKLEEIKLFQNWVILENPFNKEDVEEANKLLDALPPAAREIKAKEMLANYNYLKVLKAGELCKVKLGDTVFLSPDGLANAIYMNNEAWILIKENYIIGISNYVGA